MGDRDLADQRFLHRRSADEEIWSERESPVSNFLLSLSLMHLQRQIQVKLLLLLFNLQQQKQNYFFGWLLSH